jgi:hypothetical protein
MATLPGVLSGPKKEKVKIARGNWGSHEFVVRYMVLNMKAIKRRTPLKQKPQRLLCGSPGGSKRKPIHPR